MVVISIIAPPVEQLVERHRTVVNGPVYLGVNIIQPALFYPFSRIGVKLIIGSAAMRIGALVVLIMVCPNPKRAYAELNPGLVLVYAVAQHFDQQVHIVAPPVFYVIKTVRILFKGFCVVYILA